LQIHISFKLKYFEHVVHTPESGHEFKFLIGRPSRLAN